MASGTLKISNYGNRYAALREQLSKNPFFNEQDWINLSRGTYGGMDLDMYITSLLNTDNIVDVDKFYTDYNYKFADGKTRVASLYNEIFANRNNVDEKHYRPIYNEEGAPVLDASGNIVQEEYLASDYEYYKQVLKNQNDLNYQKYLRQVEQERKDSMSGFSKFINGIGSVGTSFLSGAANTVDGVISSAAGLISGIGAAAQGGSFSDAFVDTVASGEHRPLQFVEDWAMWFESNYTDMRDLDGNYINAGMYIGGISTTVGQMLPSFLATKGLGMAGQGISGAAGASLGLSSNTVAKTASYASQLLYYQGMSANNLRDMYKQFAANGVTVSSSAILANAALKSALEYSVEIGLSRLGGGSAMDNLIFGRKIGKSTTKSNLLSSAMWRVLKDANQEGLEEATQDFSSFMVDRAFSVLVDENFGGITELTGQSLLDAYFIGAIVNVGGSAMDIVRTDGSKQSGNIVSRKLKAWEYGLNMQSFIDNYNTVMEATEKAVRIDPSAKEKFYDLLHVNSQTKYQTAYAEMVASYRILASIYGAIGEERFKAANDVLTKITDDVKRGKFNASAMKSAAQDIYSSLFGGKEGVATIKEDALKQIEEGHHMGVVAAIERGEDVSDEVELDDETKKELDKVFTIDESIEKTVITEEGSKTTRIGNTVLIPKRLLKNAGADVAIYDVIEQDICKSVMNGTLPRLKLASDKVLSLFKELSGRDDATLVDSVYSLLLDPKAQLFKAMLISSNKDSLNLLISLTRLMDTQVKDKLVGAMTAKKLDTITKAMKTALVTYLSAQYNVNEAEYGDVLNDHQIKYIRRQRWANNLYSRVVKGEELSTNDTSVLQNRVKQMDVDRSLKERILNNLQSPKVDSRVSAMNAIANYYSNVFTSEYDGETYMPETSIPNVTFNNFLQNIERTLENFLTDVSDEDVELTKLTYGEYTPATLFEYRKKQFSDATNGKYTFTSDAKGNIIIQDAKTKERIGYHYYKRHLAAIENEDHLFLNGEELKRGNVIPLVRNREYLNDILNPELDQATKNMVTLTDVINDPSLLSSEHRNEMFNKQKGTDIESAFIYLHEYFVKNSDGNVGISVLPNGNYIFVDVAPMRSMLKPNAPKATEGSTLSDYLDTSRLGDMSKNTKIVFTDDKNVRARFISQDVTKVDGKQVNIVSNVIEINRNLANNDSRSKELEFALLHEAQHAIQFENGMNLGMDENWIYNISTDLKDKIVKNVKKHMPDLFKRRVSDDERKAKEETYKKKGERTKKAPEYINVTNEEAEAIVSDFVYHMTGESDAYGVSGTAALDTYPIIVRHTEKGAEITFSWGDKYLLEYSKNAVGVSYNNKLKQSKYNLSVKNFTSEQDLSQFIKNPSNAFILPDGKIRVLQKGAQHQDVINSITNNRKAKGSESYFNSVPQIHVDTSEDVPVVSVLIKPQMTDDTVASLLQVLDLLYENNVEFSISSIYYDSPDVNSVTVSSDEYDNGDELLYGYVDEVIASENRLAYTAPYSSSLAKGIDTETTNGDIKSKKRGRPKTKRTRKVTREVKNPTDTRVPKKHRESLKSETVEKNGKFYTTYWYETQSRYVTKEEAETTNLKYFVKEGKVTQLDPALKDLIVNATGDNKLTATLQDKIDGRKKGTLTVEDVNRYFRTTPLDKMDLKTFQMINKAFYKNPKITTPQQLQEHLNNAPSYYAARAVARSMGYAEKILSDSRIDLYEGLVDVIVKNPKLNKLYEDIKNRYENLGDSDISVYFNEGLSRHQFMRRYDGSLHESGQLGALAKELAILNFKIDGGIVKSLDATYGKDDDMTLSDYISDEGSELIKEGRYESLSELNLNDRKEKQIYNIMTYLQKSYFPKAAKEGATYEGVTKIYWDTLNKLMDKSPEDISKFSKQFMDAEVRRAFTFTLVADAVKYDPNKSAQAVKAIAETAEEIVKTTNPASLNRRIHGIVRTINAYLSREDYTRFLKDNGDIFEKHKGRLRLKEDVYKSEKIAKNGKTVLRLKEEDVLLNVLGRVQELSWQTRKGVYSSNEALALKKLYEKVLNRQIKLIEKAQSKTVKTAKEIKVIEVADDLINFNTNIEMPKVLESILDFEFTDTAKSKTKYLTNDDEYHFRNNCDQFTEANALKLEKLTQNDVDEILNWYFNSQLINEGSLSTRRQEIYNATEIYLLTYLLQTKRSNFVLTDEQRDKLEDYVERKTRAAATWLANWRVAKNKLDPDRIIVNSIKNRFDVEFSIDSVEQFRNSILKIKMSTLNKEEKKKALSKIEDARKRLLSEAVAQYKRRDVTWWERLLSLQQAMMLSGPGTWVRNYVTNFQASALNVAASPVGHAVSTLLYKVTKKQNVRNRNVVRKEIERTDADFVKAEKPLKEKLEKLSNSRDVQKRKYSDWLSNEIEKKERFIAQYKFVHKQMNEYDEQLISKLESDLNRARTLGKTVFPDGFNKRKFKIEELQQNSNEAYKLKLEELEKDLDAFLREAPAREKTYKDRVAQLDKEYNEVREELSNLRSEHKKTVNALESELSLGSQYKITGVKVNSKVASFVKEDVAPIMSQINVNMTKYDPRKWKSDTAVEQIVELAAANMTSDLYRESMTKYEPGDSRISKAIAKVWNAKLGPSGFITFVFKAMSDDPFIHKSALKYLGKILTEEMEFQQQSIAQGFKIDDAELITFDNGINSNIMVKYIADAYTMAAYDYMHKPNFWTKVEAELSRWGGPKFMFFYKQIFPFAATAWNWFIEGMQYTPAGLAVNIRNLMKLENTINSLEDKRQRGERVIDSKFARYMTERNVGKGAIGTTLFFIGALMVAFGWVGLDREDEKYKIKIGDTYIDVSDLYGSQGLWQGMTVWSMFKEASIEGKELDWWGILSASLDTMFADSVFSDMYNAFRYNESVGDWLLELPTATMNMFIPNLLKSITSTLNVHEVKYDSSVLGDIERSLVYTVPFLAYAFPKYVDPYTGETQLAYKFWWCDYDDKTGNGIATMMFNAINKLSPVKISPYNVSDNEKLAIELGVNKSMLTGRYTVNGEVIKLDNKDVQKVNQFYGELNKATLDKLFNTNAKYTVKNDDGRYVKLSFKDMDDEQKKTVIERLMDDNGEYAKVFILTSNGYKYYANNSEYSELRRLGITENLYRETNNKSGFYKD